MEATLSLPWQPHIDVLILALKKKKERKKNRVKSIGCYTGLMSGASPLPW